MGKTFDATLNQMIDDTLSDWADFLADRAGVPRGPAVALDTDLSATLQADRLFRLAGDPPTLLHLEMESSGHLGFPERLLRYNVAASAANGDAEARSVIVLLRPAANASDLTGVLERGTPPYLTFRYSVVRVWEESAAALRAVPGLAPLAVLTNESARDPNAAFHKTIARLRQPDVSPELSRQLINSTFFLAGLRYNDEQITAFYEDVAMQLEDSRSYHLILRKGKLEGKLEASRNFLVRVATKRFGPPPPGVLSRLEAVTDPALLDPLADLVSDATNWDDLIATL